MTPSRLQNWILLCWKYKVKVVTLREKNCHVKLLNLYKRVIQQSTWLRTQSLSQFSFIERMNLDALTSLRVVILSAQTSISSSRIWVQSTTSSCKSINSTFLRLCGGFIYTFSLSFLFSSSFTFQYSKFTSSSICD